VPDRLRVLVGISMHPNVLARLREVAEVDVSLAYVQDLPTTIARYDGMIVYSPRFDPAILSGAARLKVIACHACPPEILSAAIARAIRVTLVPSLWDTVADMALSLLFAAARHVAQADAAIRRGEWGQADLKARYSGLDVFGKTLGIIGLGRIGAILARRLRGLEMKLLYYDVVHRPELEKELGIAYRTLEQLLRESDIVSVQLPLTDETRGLIGEREFRLMKPDAILINTARGAILDEAVLCRALQERWIAAAGLDVLAEEPIRPDSPLLGLDNVVLAPHLGGSTKECDGVLVEDAIRVLEGREPLHPAAP
jgi:glyoxylate reductase